MTMADFPPVRGEDVDFGSLREKDPEELIEMGMRWWDEEETLMLFPHQWREHIPRRMKVTSINGESKRWFWVSGPFDARFGMLAWGIEVGDD